MENKTSISKDTANKKMVITRNFNAPLEQVWKAWTDSSILDQWWAPEPYKAMTKSMDFSEGGFWLYAMVGPDGSEMYARFDYTSIVPLDYFSGLDSFCDDNGNKTNNFPGMSWKNNFSSAGNGTKVEVEVTFKSEADMQKIIELGFEEGFTAAHGNLDRFLEKQ